MKFVEVGGTNIMLLMMPSLKELANPDVPTRL